MKIQNIRFCVKNRLLNHVLVQKMTFEKRDLEEMYEDISDGVHSFWICFCF